MYPRRGGGREGMLVAYTLNSFLSSAKYQLCRKEMTIGKSLETTGRYDLSHDNCQLGYLLR